MHGRALGLSWVAVLAAILASMNSSVRAGELDAQVAFFESKIRPVLVRECYACHAEGAKSIKGGLRVDSKQGMRIGGDSGPAVVPGKPDESPLLEALRHEGLAMPPKGKLSDIVIADFRRWIEQGAHDPREAGPTVAKKAEIDLKAGRAFWAYQPVRSPKVHDVQNSSWPLNDLDRFLIAALEAKGLRPVADADRATLIRRVYFDLVGLPPSPEAVAAFEADRRPDAFERIVDRLMGDPRFGERWGRHWLDLARFAESQTLRGLVMKEAWRYRDYVIDAINQDLPYDRFLREQIAGDLIPAESWVERRRQRLGIGFLTLGNTNLEEQDKGQLRMDVVDEQIDVIGKAILGQTIACARCHDHKFDPIPTKDYYAIAGILRNARALEDANVSKWLERPLPAPPEVEQAHKRQDAKAARLEAEIKALRQTLAKGKSTPRLKAMEAELKRVITQGPKPELAMALVEEPVISEIRVHVRGSVHTLGEAAPRGFLRVASWGPGPEFPSNESGRRELADWLASPKNPLAARVFVNRAWHWVFGRGLVSTTDNFGTTGELPSNPELLDHLAHRFVQGGWSVKRLVRSLVLSRAYRLATTDDAKALAVDPENRLHWRANRRRLEAECLRDAMLTASGSLDSRMGGRGFANDLAEDYGYKKDAFNPRRSVYLPVFRNALPELFEVFDFADPSLVVGQRNSSTVAPQALYLLNHPFVLDQSRRVAERLLASDDSNDSARLDRAYRLMLGRSPSAHERAIGLDFLKRESDPGKGWALLVQAIFASVDFRTLD